MEILVGRFKTECQQKKDNICEENGGHNVRIASGRLLVSGQPKLHKMNQKSSRVPQTVLGD